jgi:hypothetical protein
VNGLSGPGRGAEVARLDRGATGHGVALIGLQAQHKRPNNNSWLLHEKTGPPPGGAGDAGGRA